MKFRLSKTWCITLNELTVHLIMVSGNEAVETTMDIENYIPGVVYIYILLNGLTYNPAEYFTSFERIFRII